MQNPHGMSSNPSNPDSEADGFSPCWGATSLPTACAVPAS
jgi:hypothetical protein